MINRDILFHAVSYALVGLLGIAAIFLATQPALSAEAPVAANGTILTLEFIIQMFTVGGVIVGAWFVIHKRINHNEMELLKYKTYVAENYVHTKSLAEIEERISTEMRRLGDRLDKIFVHLTDDHK